MTKTMTEMTLIKISLQKRNYFKKYMREGCMFNSMFKAIPICVFESTPECSLIYCASRGNTGTIRPF